jgi:hypothetical protein
MAKTSPYIKKGYRFKNDINVFEVDTVEKQGYRCKRFLNGKHIGFTRLTLSDIYRMNRKYGNV